MLNRPPYAAALFLALVVTPILPRAAMAQCPTNSMFAPGASQVSSNPSGNLAGSSTCVEGGNIRNTISGYALYDLPAGHVQTSVQGGPLCPSSANLSTHDIFTLTGPGVSPISFRAELNVGAYVIGDGAAGAALREGASNSSGYGSSKVGITITASPGSSFDLYMLAFASGGYYSYVGAYADAWLSFPDLPPGYLLQSCQGYVAGGVVPVRAASWGKLKTLYR